MTTANRKEGFHGHDLHGSLKRLFEAAYESSYRFLGWIVHRVLWPVQCLLGFHHSFTIGNDTGSGTQCWRCGKVLESARLYLDRDESLRGSPYTLDLSPNPALPPLERALQASLLRVIVEFGSIARDLDYLGRSKRNGDFLTRNASTWSDAHTCAFTQVIEHSGCEWL